MNLHFLVNISSDTENLYGIRFFSSFFGDDVSCNVTLFHICRLDSNDASGTLLEAWQNPEDKVEGNLTVGAKKALDKAKRDIQRNHVNINEMKTKSVKERYGKVKDILGESSQGLYDAMILGRRATYALQWLFDRPADEIPLALINDTTLNCPLWVCAEPEYGRKNVLLCVDGGESSYRAADHVGYVLSQARQHTVTVFHATAADSGSDGIFARTVDILVGQGVEKERIHTKKSWSVSPATTILSEKNAGRYAAVAVGLEGNSGGFLARIGAQGGTTAALIKKISKASLWCVP
ncbi:MAG TPA: hypothetical protein VJ969_12150 [Desulfopila sp.]|nr:hypothetical protein [Desulfopila sp.]